MNNSNIIKEELNIGRDRQQKNFCPGTNPGRSFCAAQRYHYMPFPSKCQ